jgi:hypothetical protein
MPECVNRTLQHKKYEMKIEQITPAACHKVESRCPFLRQLNLDVHLEDSCAGSVYSCLACTKYESIKLILFDIR